MMRASVENGVMNADGRMQAQSIAYIRTPDAASLRVARYGGHHTPSHGTIVICMGFAETIEKYSALVDELLMRQFDVVLFEWRGQGLSSRMVRDPSKGHIDDFSLYERDLEAIVMQVLRPFCPRPWFALAHSMGASIVLAHASHQRCPFDRIVLSAPMIALHHIAQQSVGRVMIECADLIGLGEMALPLGWWIKKLIDHFETNILTSDKQRFQQWQKIKADLGKSTIVAPTIGWVHAALRCMDEFMNPEFARHIHVPALVFSAGDDRLIDSRIGERFASRLKAGSCIRLPFARHDLVHEKAEIRALFWAGFDAFIPGTAQS